MFEIENKFNDNLRESVQRSVEKDMPHLKKDPIGFINEVSKRFIEARLDSFPQLCEITRWQNKIKMDQLRQIDQKGKYTDSIGWSPEREFKFDYEIPNELYLFMTNLVYKDFWSNDNARIWRKFMKGICRGDDPMELLIAVKKLYGSNSQIQKVTLN